MLRNDQKLVKSVIDVDNTQYKWKDRVELSEQCQERFLVQSNLPELAEEGIVMCGMADMREHYLVEREGGDHHTLLVCIDGEGVVTNQNMKCHVPGDHLVILPAKTAFKFELCSNSENWRFIWITTPQLPCWQHLIEEGQRIIPFQHSEQIWSLCSLLSLEAENRASFRTLYISEITRLLSKANKPANNSLLRVESQFNRIESQLHHNWSIANIAAACHISEEHLGRLCRQLYGCSPQQKLISLRMQRAQNLLAAQGDNISTIALRVGYKDPYAFSSRFKRFVGVSPKAYRQQQQQ
ncbi:helix-turn-helix transcriptional regulator [Photobacterium sp. BZF1]|uniref:helix-turn-helix transcriptional regulator n=1 Tax=Photobacterium sp. BZF1 TaxID=1904457 RepID=UPI001653AF7E|nr:AraC family transcriptional regulator [Photobacterium sp. BZF1]MBC7003176.1 helix-turn-helix transcriptional regulator [Photobacterium sp. BZF1]